MAVVAFFLLLVALPAGSYLWLHRAMVVRYEVLADAVEAQAVQVRIYSRCIYM